MHFTGKMLFSKVYIFDMLTETKMPTLKQPIVGNLAPQKSKRMSPSDRKEHIISAAVELFAEVGFDGSTRDIAERAEITQPLLYRYFPNKETLIEAVYARVFLERWNPRWDVLLEDRCISVRERFQNFYEEYTQTIFDPVWLRISNFAALREAGIHDWYNQVVEEMILKRLVRERRFELTQDDSFYVSREELEKPWILHGGLLHYGVRRHVLKFEVNKNTSLVIAGALDMYLNSTIVRQENTN